METMITRWTEKYFPLDLVSGKGGVEVEVHRSHWPRVPVPGAIELCVLRAGTSLRQSAFGESESGLNVSRLTPIFFVI